MAILEKKINPSLRLKIRDAYQQGKKDSDLVNQLLISEGKGGSPNTPTPDWDKDWPKPGTKPRPEDRPNIPTKLANLADGEADPSIINHVTVGGFFLDGQGKAYMQTGGKLYDAGEYNPDIHGLPVPLAQKKLQINPKLAHAGPGQYYTEEGEVTDVSPYTFNRNTTQMEVPWLKEEYYQDLPRREKLHEDLKIRK
jgi:hypothetical protein